MKTNRANLLMAVTLLLLLGIAALFSATADQTSLQRLTQHLCSVGMGLVGCAAMATLDYSWLRKRQLPRWLLGILFLLLLAVFLPGIGSTRNGASRWLLVGQPSELVKLALIIFLADYAAVNQTRMGEGKRGFVRPGLVAALLVALIFLEPDWGGAFLMATVTLAMLVVAGASWSHLISAVIIGGELFARLLLSNSLRLERVFAFLEPQKYKAGIGWQAWISLRALAHGGWLGTFPGEGIYKNGYVPEQQTDFVFSLIGEELGLLGSWLVLVLFSVIVISGSRIAWRVADPFGRFLAFGITFLIGAQALFNICVVTSCLPNKGIALPLVSYGGSNMVVTLAGIGILLNIARRGPFLDARKPVQAEFNFQNDLAPRPPRSFQAPPARHSFQAGITLPPGQSNPKSY